MGKHEAFKIHPLIFLQLFEQSRAVSAIAVWKIVHGSWRFNYMVMVSQTSRTDREYCNYLAFGMWICEIWWLSKISISTWCTTLLGLYRFGEITIYGCRYLILRDWVFWPWWTAVQLLRKSSAPLMLQNFFAADSQAYPFSMVSRTIHHHQHCNKRIVYTIPKMVGLWLAYHVV